MKNQSLSKLSFCVLVAIGFATSSSEAKLDNWLPKFFACKQHLIAQHDPLQKTFDGLISGRESFPGADLEESRQIGIELKSWISLLDNDHRKKRILGYEVWRALISAWLKDPEGQSWMDVPLTISEFPDLQSSLKYIREKVSHRHFKNRAELVAQRNELLEKIHEVESQGTVTYEKFNILSEYAVEFLSGIDFDLQLASKRLRNSARFLARFYFPTSEKLEIEDFQPSHPIHLLQMVSTPTNADGALYGPLQFWAHDRGHSRTMTYKWMQGLNSISDSGQRVLITLINWNQIARNYYALKEKIDAILERKFRNYLRVIVFYLYHESGRSAPVSASSLNQFVASTFKRDFLRLYNRIYGWGPFLAMDTQSSEPKKMDERILKWITELDLIRHTEHQARYPAYDVVELVPGLEFTSANFRNAFMMNPVSLRIGQPIRLKNHHENYIVDGIVSDETGNLVIQLKSNSGIQTYQAWRIEVQDEYFEAIR